MRGTSYDKIPAASVGQRPARQARGLLYGLGAYTAWGFFPLYFRAVADVPATVVVCHRIIWSLLFLLGVVAVRKEWKPIWLVMRDRRRLALLSTGAVLIALNWLVFVYAVASRQVLQSSLGYFINPLVSIALGLLFLRERLRAWQWLAVIIAGAAVLNLVWRGAGVPWMALALAGTFGLYGLVRKRVDASPLHALLVETAVLAPAALATLALPVYPDTPHSRLALLSLSGIITAIPLLMFGAALRSLKLSTIGLLQYIVPSLQFVVALLFLKEPLDQAKLTSFCLCWLAVAVYVTDSICTRLPQPVAAEPE